MVLIFQNNLPPHVRMAHRKKKVKYRNMVKLLYPNFIAKYNNLYLIYVFFNIYIEFIPR